MFFQEMSILPEHFFTNIQKCSVLFLGQKSLVDRMGRFLPRSHGKNDRGRTGHDIAAGIHAVFRGLHGHFIDNDAAPLLDL